MHLTDLNDADLQAAIEDAALYEQDALADLDAEYNRRYEATKARIAAEITTSPDRHIEEWIFMVEVRAAELAEIDGTLSIGKSASLEAHRDERDRRIAEGISIDDPNAETLEERLAPFGTEWQIEQREREEGRG
jgi:hypothetical protein